MRTCPSCGAERKLVGVMFPARQMCNCEEGTCSQCDQPAAIVEFQKPVKNEEPEVGGKLTVLYCFDHAPDGFPVTAPALKAANDAPLKPGVKVKRGRLPHVDPAWEACRPGNPPKDAASRLRVKCVSCKDEHEMRKRVMFNGTNSVCPSCCTENMYVPVWDEKEEDDVRRAQ